MINARGESGFLAEVARQIDDADAPVAAAPVEEARERVVARAVVDEDQLETQRRALEQRHDRVEEEVNRLFLVEHGNDQRQQRICRPSLALRGKLTL